jgi:aminoglycoside phosphotransferase family enzyme
MRPIALHAPAAGSPPPRREAARIDALMRPECYPHPVERIRLIETHLSWVLLTGEHAYKVKKPVDLGFADFSTLERRRHFCEEELRLNRRYAPSIYLDVVGIRETPRGPALRGDGPVIEYAVKMRQFPQDALASRMLEAGALSRDHVRSLAERIAAYHARAAVAGTVTRHGEPPGEPDAVLGAALENIDQLTGMGLPHERQLKLHELRLWTQRHFAGLREAALARKVGGFVRECHGDLHLDNVALLDGTLTPFDGIEFNDKLRWIDVASDVAFAVMDLAAHGRPDLAWEFLDAYLEQTGDYAGLEMLRFYIRQAGHRRAIHHARPVGVGKDDRGRSAGAGAGRDSHPLRRRAQAPRRPVAAGANSIRDRNGPLRRGCHARDLREAAIACDTPDPRRPSGHTGCRLSASLAKRHDAQHRRGGPLSAHHREPAGGRADAARAHSRPA